MRWSKATRLALHAALELARAPRGEHVTSQAIAERYRVSLHHLTKVMVLLARAGIARGVRGAGGGYTLAQAPGRVTLRDVVAAVEGPPAAGCSVRDDAGPCPAPCSLRTVLDEIDAGASARLAEVTLADLIEPGPAPPRRRRLPVR